MLLTRMITGLLARMLGLLPLTWRRRDKPDTDAIFQAGRNAGLEEATATQAAQTPARKSRGVHGGRGMPEDRARFVAAFLARAFRGRKTTSIFCHEDKPFPDIRAGGEIKDIQVAGSGEDYRLTISLNHYVWFLDGHVDIELERDAPMLRVESFAPCGATIRLVFMPSDGYGMDTDDYDLWAKSRRALDREEYFDISETA